MPRVRPPTSGYERIAQAEEEEDIDESEEEDFRHGHRSLSASAPQYAPIQPERHGRMQAPGYTSPGRRSPKVRRHRSNSGVDIKAINARLERWADEIAAKFKIGKGKEKTGDEEKLEIHHSVFQAPDWIRPATADALASDPAEQSGERTTKIQFDDIVESVRVAIELGIHPKLISQGSSGSYFARNTDGKVVGVFKPKDEEPYASRNPKWTKWIHRNLFPFFFGRACLIPNLSYVSEAAAYVLDTRLRTNLVPYTDIVYLSSKSFYYDFWDRRAYYRKKKPLPQKVGSFQVFLKGFQDANIFLKAHPWPDQYNPGFRTDAAPKKKPRPWAEDCRPGGAPSDSEDEEDLRPTSAREAQRRKGFWTEALQKSFREELQKLVILDYIMRNTDRGLDNWMIKIDTEKQEATIVAEPPKSDDNHSDEDNKHPPRFLHTDANGNTSAGHHPYRRQDQMTTSPNNSDSGSAHWPSVRIGAIDNSLSWPWKHPDALWWSETQSALRRCFSQDADFKESMFAKQLAVMKGQAWNVVETLKTPDHGPLELTRRARVCVWDDVVEIPTVVPLRVPSTEMRRQEEARKALDDEEMDISAAHAASAPLERHDLLNIGSPVLEMPGQNRFDLSRHANGMKAVDGTTSRTMSPDSVHAMSWDAQGTLKEGQNKRESNGFPEAVRTRSRLSMDEARRHRESASGRHRGFSLNARRSNAALLYDGDDLEGDLGYSAAADMEGNRKKVIVERLEMVKAPNPVFKYC